MLDRGFCSSALVLGAAALAVIGAPTLAQASGWTGCYIGGHIGYARAEADVADRPFIQGPFAGSGASWNSFGATFETLNASESGASGGGEAGCDYEITSAGTTIVAGLVTDLDALDVSGSATSSLSNDTHSSFELSYIGSVRGRLGVGTESWLIYVTGGYAYAGIDVRAYDLDASNLSVMDVSGGGTESGWVIGGGFEHRLAAQWSLSLEYLHYEFDGIVATGAATFPPEAFPRFDNDLDVDVVRVGAKWRP